MEELFTERIRILSRPLAVQPTRLAPRLQEMRGLKAVIFDIYGTLFLSGSGDIGTASAHPGVSALVEALREQGVEMPEDLAESAMARFYELIALNHAREKQRGTEVPEIRILDIWEQWRREAQVQIDVPQLAIDVECRLNPVWPMPGLENCLQGISDLSLGLGVVSNAQVFTPCLFPALTGKSLAEFGFNPAHCVWSWTLKEAKPSLRLYQNLLGKLEGIQPEECLFVGNDMLNDVMPAQRVGMRTALFAGDRRSLRLRSGDSRVQGVEPDLVLTHLNQLVECLVCPN